MFTYKKNDVESEGDVGMVGLNNFLILKQNCTAVKLKYVCPAVWPKIADAHQKFSQVG